MWRLPRAGTRVLLSSSSVCARNSRLQHQSIPPLSSSPEARDERTSGHLSSSRRGRSRGRGSGQRPRQLRQHRMAAQSERPVRVPQSLDVSVAEGIVDVEKFFPEAMAHLKAPARTEAAAEEQERRDWHDATNELNADGYHVFGKPTAEERASRVHSFFDEGGLDIRDAQLHWKQGGSVAGSLPPPLSRNERLSPDILQLSGGRARQHGAALGEETNQAAFDQTIEGDTALASGERSEFGDTPVQVTDMLRERLMELKADRLHEERNDTYMPRRLNLLSDVAVRERELMAVARSKERQQGSRGAVTLADLEGAAEHSPDSNVDTAPALGDGFSPSGMQSAAEVLHTAVSYVPGGAPGEQRDMWAHDTAAGNSRSRFASHSEREGHVHLMRVLPRAGLSSRREAGAIIAGGQVRVNNVVERNPFFLVRPEDDVTVAGHASRLRYAPARLWMYHKPANVIVSRNDVAGRTLITKHARILGMDHLIPVGSLPMRAHGLLLLTNDGELSSFLENPKSMIQQTYLLRVRPAIDPVLAHRLNTEGLFINGRRYSGVEVMVNPTAKSRYSVKVKVRGEAMPVAHLMQHLGRTVERGGRTSFGPFSLGTLAVGSVREVTVPPHYAEHLGAVWKPFVERDWPYFRRQRVARLRKLARYRELTPKELEELDNFTYEEVNDALSFESQELATAADERAALMAARHGQFGSAMPADFASSEDVAADVWNFDDTIIEDITRAE